MEKRALPLKNPSLPAASGGLACPPRGDLEGAGCGCRLQAVAWEGSREQALPLQKENVLLPPGPGLSAGGPRRPGPGSVLQPRRHPLSPASPFPRGSGNGSRRQPGRSGRRRLRGDTDPAPSWPARSKANSERPPRARREPRPRPPPPLADAAPPRDGDRLGVVRQGRVGAPGAQGPGQTLPACVAGAPVTSQTIAFRQTHRIEELDSATAPSGDTDLSYYVGTQEMHTEIKKVAEEKVTLPCHHQLGVPETDTLDIEWLLTDNEGNQKVVITSSGRHVYSNFTEEQKGRVAFASNFIAGDASLEIEPLKPSDEGRYTCKVKNSGRYMWSHVILKVLVRPSKPKCELEGELTEGSDLTLQCESSSGTQPIVYSWQRVQEKDGESEHLPAKSKIDYKNPGRILLQNLTMASSGLYQCTAGNEAGKESCLVRVTVQYVQSIGMVAGAVTGIVAGALLIFLLVWLLIRRKDKKRYEEEERPNEIREDAEAPKARLVKPSSSSSGSQSSRSGSSSTRSTANSASRSQRTLSSEAAPQPGLAPHPYSLTGPGVRCSEPKKVHPATVTKAEATPCTVPSHSKAFQTV
ncbi:CXADR-like membrane protein [Ctenodactylus gundi]